MRKKPDIEALRKEAMQLQDPTNRQKMLDAIDGIERGHKLLDESDERMDKRKKARNWGGAREGAGGPTIMGEPASERLAFRITKQQAKAIDAMRHPGESRNQAARRILLDTIPQE